MTITVNHYVHLDPAVMAYLQQMEARIVSALSDKITAVTASTDAAISRVQADVTNLKSEIAALQAQVDAGGASQADLDALDALKAKLDALDPATPAVLPSG